MPFAIMRALKHKSVAALRKSSKHNSRRADVPNADADAPGPVVVAGSDLADLAVQERIDALGLRMKKDTVIAIELVLTASPEWWRRDDQGRACNVEQIAGFERRAMGWARDIFGADNVVSAIRHNDEASPHLHVIVTPVDDTPRQRGPAVRLNAKRWLGGRQKLEQLQDSYADAVSDLGLERGVRRTGRRHQPAARWRAEMAAELEKATEETTALMQEVSTEADRVAKQREEADRDREAARKEREHAHAFAAGVHAWSAGDLVDADHDERGRKRLRYRDEKARERWSLKIRPAAEAVWSWVRRQTGFVRELVERERQRVVDRLEKERASERALVRDLARDLRSVRKTVGVVGGGVDERADRIERRAQRTVQTSTREAPTWVRDAHKEADDIGRKRQAKNAREGATPTPPAPAPRRRWPWPTRDRDAER